MNSSGNLGVVLVTAASQEQAWELAGHLVAESLAACVNVFPVESIYRWQGEIHEDTEWQLVIKTDLAQCDRLIDRITALHSYEVPEVIALPIVQGSEAYLNWMVEQTRTSQQEDSQEVN